jgi:hypothetical protein
MLESGATGQVRFMNRLFRMYCAMEGLDSSMTFPLTTAQRFRARVFFTSVGTYIDRFRNP